MKLSLIVLTHGPKEGQAIPVSGTAFTIGRDQKCRLRPASTLISSHHCVLQKMSNKILVRDLGSSNGTFINDQRVWSIGELRDKDHLRVGPLEFEVKLEKDSDL